MFACVCALVFNLWFVVSHRCIIADYYQSIGATVINNVITNADGAGIGLYSALNPYM